MIGTIRLLLMLCLAGLPVRSYANYTFDLTDGLGHNLGDLVLPVASCELTSIPGPPGFTECPTATIDFDTGINLYNGASAFQIETSMWHFDGSGFTDLSQVYFVLNNSPDGDGLTLDLSLGYFYENQNWFGGGQADPPIASGPVIVALVAGQDVPEPRFLGFLAFGLFAPVVLIRRFRRPRVGHDIAGDHRLLSHIG